MSEPVAEPDWKIPIRVEAREGFQISVEFNDGVSGIADLSDLADQEDFSGWRDRAYFERLRIGEYDHVYWDDSVACVGPDDLYQRVTGLTEAEVYPELAEEIAQRRDGPSPTDVVAVEPRDGYSLWVEFADGTSGIADLTFLASGPAFAGWQDREYFESVRLAGGGDVTWGDDLERCGYSLYIDVTGLPWEEVMKLYGRSPSPV